MRHLWIGTFVLLAMLSLPPRVGLGADAPSYERIEDVIYGRKHGIALTMDVFKPREGAHGTGVIYVVSGGWYSAHEAINPEVFGELLKRGYTVFAVVHGSQPKFTIPEIIEDMHRSVRYIRHHAERFGIKPDRLGITGGSAGGHLSLMMGLAGRPGNPEAKDPVDREPSGVQAVACFFPPTDFLNYGQTGRDLFKALEEELAPFKAPFDFQEFDTQTRQFVLIRDLDRRREIAREISPVAHVTPDDPPTLIAHGNADTLVPIQQAEVVLEKLRTAGVPTRLVTREGQGHGWANWTADVAIFADWFDQHLRGQSGEQSTR